MRGAILLPIFLNLATTAEAQPRSLGIFFQWGALEEGNHCFAIAEPERSTRPREWKPSASIGYWPGHGVRGQPQTCPSPQERAGWAGMCWDERRVAEQCGGAGRIRGY